MWDVDADARELARRRALPRRIGAEPAAGVSPTLARARGRAPAGPLSGRGAVNAARQVRRLSRRTSPMSRSIPKPGKVTSCATPRCRTSARPSIPTYVEGQMQGGAVQGIGWALNEEYCFDARRRAGEPQLPRLPHAGRLGPADDRHGDRRGAESGPSVRRARRRRGADLRADGGGRPTRSTMR